MFVWEVSRLAGDRRQSNVTPIPKGPLSSSVVNYRPICITSVLSKVFERLVLVHLRGFMERSGALPTTQFAYRKGLDTCDEILCVSHTLQSELESEQEDRIIQINFSAAFDRVNHQEILIVVSRSTMHPQSPPLTIDGTVLNESDDLVILGVTFDLKMTFEKHFCSVSRAASQRLGILRKSWQMFHDRSLLGDAFGVLS